MRLTLALVLSLFLATPALAAQAPKAKKKTVATQKTAKKKAVKRGQRAKFQARLLSYRQLARLPKEKRLRYLKEVKELLVLLERYQNQYEVASYQSQYREFVARLMQEASPLPQADALSDSEIQQLYLRQAQQARERRLSQVRPAWNGNEFLCGSNVRFSNEAGTCLLENFDGDTNFEIGKCPRGFREIPHPTAKSPTLLASLRACVPDASWAALPAARQQDLTSGRVLRSDFFYTAPVSERLSAVTGGTIAAVPMSQVATGVNLPAAKPAPNAPVDVNVPQVSPASGGSGGDGAVAGTTVPAKAATDANASDGAKAGTSTEKTISPHVSTSAGLEAASVLPGTPVLGVDVEDPNAAPPTPETPAEPTAPAEVATCEPEELACKSLSAEERQLAINRFRSNGNRDDALCVSGGFLSRYKGQRKEVGNCEVVTAINNPRAPKDASGKGVVRDCRAGGQAYLCNPVLFCVSNKKAKPSPDATTTSEAQFLFCVDKDTRAGRGAQPITERCNQEFARIISGQTKKNRDGKDVMFDEVPPEVAPNDSWGACDPYAFKDLPLQDEWDQLKKDTELLVNNWCGGGAERGDWQALFCAECSIIRARFYAMGKIVNQSPCAVQTADGGTLPAAPNEPTVAPAPIETGTPAVREGADPDILE